VNTNRYWKYVYPDGHRLKGKGEQSIYCMPLRSDRPGRPRLVVVHRRQWRFVDFEGRPIYDIRIAVKVRDLLRVESLQKKVGIVPDRWRKSYFKEAVDSLTDGKGAPLTAVGKTGDGITKYTSSDRGIEAELRIPSLTRYLGDYRLGDIDVAILSDFIAHRHEEGKSNNTIRRDLCTLSVVYDYFVRRRMVEPAQHVRKIISDAGIMPSPSKPTQVDSRRVLSRVQLAAYRLAAFEVYKTVERRAITHNIAADTGQRPTEILRARRENLRLNAGHLLISPNTGMTKHQKSDAFTNMRRVWLSDDVVALIRDYTASSESEMLIAEEDRINNDQLKRIHWKIQRIAATMVPAPRYTEKALRHTRGTLFFEQEPPAGVSMGDYLLAVADHMGHSKSILLDRYVHRTKAIDLYGRTYKITEAGQQQPCADPDAVREKVMKLQQLGAPAGSVSVILHWLEE